MSSSSESKIPFIILLPFVALVFAMSLRSGAPTAPSMPGVLRPATPVVLAPVAPTPIVEPGKADPAAAPVTTEAAPEAAAESWE